jgi:CubicO group peptidase (beta-lactamase class C family)
VVALGRVLAVATGQDVPAFADEALFHPLGIVGARWARFDAGRQTDSGGHLMLRPRDLARIGQLLLQQGRWGGRTIVSREWIERATAEQTRIDGGRPYGYLWWRRSFPFRGDRVDAFSAEGNGGQYLFVLPQLELVVVFTGGNYNSPKAGRPLRMMANDLLPAILD